MNVRLFWTTPLIGAQIVAAQAKDLATQGFAAPPTPPQIEREAVTDEGRLHSAATTYSIGDPTPKEQLYIEFINRSWANPSGEAQIFATSTDANVVANYDFFNVDLALMLQQFAALPAAPPVAPNAQLTAAARRHTGDMLTNSFQGHVGSDGSTFVQRVTAAGYTYSSLGENVYSSADSVFHGHAGFDVDWGPGVGGMQTPPGHRITIHDPTFREVGVGVLFGNNTPAAGSQIPGAGEVGPQLVTQEFGTTRSATPIITGVVYYDLNGNNFYDAGEGIGGVGVAASSTAATAVTARSGGYALPVAGNGTYAVTFTGQGLTTLTQQVTIAQSRNQKVDFRPAYAAPGVTGPAEPLVNRPNSYQIAAVPMATAYQWRRYQLVAPAVEGAENGTAGVTIEQGGTYAVIQSATRKTGAYAFQLTHQQPQVREQRITLIGSYKADLNSVLRFASRLGWASENQKAVVQISTDNGGTWVEKYSQAGDRSPGETTFQDRSISLQEFAGQTMRVRFVFRFEGGVYYPDADDETGWFIDDITWENAFEIGNEQVSDAVNRAFTFEPASASDFVLQGRARTGHDFLPWGPELIVRAREGTGAATTLRIAALRIVNGKLEFDVERLSGAGPMTLSLQSKALLSDSWTPGTITATEAISGSSVRVTAVLDGSRMAFYRIGAQ
jgi:hypothetical protein